jgi:uncharacterized protein (UPF0305 family)
MALPAKKTRLSSLGTPVIDLSLIVVISLLTLGSIQALLPNLELEELGLIEQDQKAAMAEQPGSMEELFDQLTREQQALEAQLADLAQRAQIDSAQVPEPTTDANEPMELRALMAAYTERVEALRHQLENLGTEEQDLEDLNEVLSGRDSEIEKLRDQHEKMAQELDGLNAKVARYERFKSRLTPPDAVSDPNREGNEDVRTRWFRHGYENNRLVVLLVSSRVFIMEPPHVKVYRSGHVQLREPRGSGMSPSEALAPGSPLMRMVSRPSFRENGWILALVNKDSFASYRALRDALNEKGIRIGWEPHSGSNVIGFGPGGKKSGPQSK